MPWQGTKPDQFADAVEKSFTAHQRDICTTALQGLITTSPVDTGAYRGNHRVSIDAEDFVFSADDLDKSGNATLSRGKAVIAQVKTVGVVVYLQNNAAYAGVLEKGHSKGAENGIYGPVMDLIREMYR